MGSFDGRSRSGAARCVIFGLALWLLGFPGTVGNSDSATTDSNIPTITNYIRQASETPPLECKGSSSGRSQHYETSPFGTIEISSQADANKYSGCSILYADIVIENDTLESIVLSGIEALDGSLTVFNCTKLQSISAPALGKLRYGSSFTLSNLPLLHTVHLPALNRSIDNIYWSSLPLLKEPNNTKIYAPYHITLENTGLINTEFLTFSASDEYNYIYNQSYGDIRITNNPDLSVVSLNDLVSINTGRDSVLEITYNAPGTKVLLQALVSVSGITISSVLSIEIPLLETIYGTLLVSDSSLTNFSSPSLTKILGDLIFKNNHELPYLGFPLLKKLQSYHGSDYYENDSANIVVENNAVLSVIEFPSLDLNYFDKTDITISGPISRLKMDIMEAYVGSSYYNLPGDFKVNSTGSDLDCREFDKLRYRTVNDKDSTDSELNATYLCQSIALGSKHDTAKHWKPPFRLSKAGKIAVIVVGSVVGGIIFVFLLRYCHRHAEPYPPSRPQPIILTRPGVAVHRERNSTGGEAEDHELPEYKQVGEPGEIPPEYLHVVPVSSSTSNGSSQSGPSRSTEESRDVEAGTGTPPVYHQNQNGEADDYLAAHDQSDQPVHRETQATSSPPTEDAVTTPAAPAMRERSLLGKLWYGRALVPVKPSKPSKPRDNRPLWRRVYYGSRG